MSFTDASAGATSWSWDFGNTNTSTLPNPQAIFSSPGTYTVSLTVSNGSTSDTETKTGYIIVHEYPTVDFTFDKTSGCAPLTVNFTDNSTAGSGTNTEWFWVFGDGGTSTEQNPAYAYLDPGDKSISLRVKNQFGCESSAVKSPAVTVRGPVVDFTANNTAFCQVPATVQFTNHTTGNAPLAWSWDFGDGSTSTEEDPSYTFTTAGEYTATLSVEDAQGCIAASAVTIQAGSEGGLDFQPSATELCMGQPVTFNVQATSGIVTAEWDFGNGTSSTQPNPPAVTYTQPGTYAVELKALLQGKTCHSVVTKTIEVFPDPVPAFTYSADCDNKVTFASTSAHAASLRWQLNTGASYTTESFTYPYGTPGSYAVKLTAYNKPGCGQTIERIISVAGKPVAAFSPDKEQACLEESLAGCAPFTVNFKNKSASSTSFTSRWLFGDGGSSNSTDASHTYAQGTYTVSLEITNTIGCTSTKSATVTVSDVTPVAKFSLDKTTACAYEQVKFTDESTDATFWCWDFGDGSTGTGRSPIHTYAEPGTYTVRLTARNAGCSSTFEITDAIQVNDPHVDYKIEKNCTDPYAISITNNSSGFTSLQWDFGDGTLTNTDAGGHRYAATGDYKVKLTATNSTNLCVVNVVRSVSIYDVEADFTLDNAKPCRDAPVNFTDQSQSAVAWRWSFDNSEFSQKQHPATSYQASGLYTVTLQAFDADGCLDVKTAQVEVLNIQSNFIFSAASTCNALEVAFTDQSSASPSILNWHWDFGDGQTSTDVNPVHTYSTLGAYPVTLTLTNADGTCTFLKKDAIRFTNPVPDFVVAKPGYCILEPVKLVNQTINAVSYEWDLGNSQTPAVVSPWTSYEAAGRYDVTLKATDQYGCEKAVTKPEFVVVTQPVALFDAFDTYSECPPLTSIFQDRSEGGIKSLRWDFGNGENSTLANPACTYLKPGEYDVTLVVTDSNNCRDTLTQEEIIHVGGPYGSFAADGTDVVCTNDSVRFTAGTTNTAIHRWDYGDGYVEDLPGMLAAHLYEAAGSFNVALVLIDAQGCEVVADGQAPIDVYDSTAIDIAYAPCIFLNEELVLQAVSEESGMSWEWFIDEAAAGTGPGIPAVFSTTGMHNISLRAANPYGCISGISYDVAVQGDVSFVPNVFTPNQQDALNSVFEIRGLEESDWHLEVYNRWGSRVYRKTHYANTWNGGDLATGVYFYELINAVCPHKKHKGTVSIIR